MSYLTKEQFKQELNDKVISMRPDEKQDFIEAFFEVMEVNDQCYSCRKPFEEYEKIFCFSCYNTAKQEIKRLNERMGDLQEDLREEINS